MYVCVRMYYVPYECVYIYVVSYCFIFEWSVSNHTSLKNLYVLFMRQKALLGPRPPQC